MQAVHPPKTEEKNIYSVRHVRVDVPYRLPGNVVKHFPVEFQVHTSGNSMWAIPLCNEIIKRMTALPERVVIRLENGKPVLLPADKGTIKEELVTAIVSLGTKILF